MEKTLLFVISSPLDQFEVRNLLSIDAPILANIHLSITNIGLYLTTAAFILLTINLLATNYKKIVSNSWSLSQESIYATVHGIVVNQINATSGVSLKIRGLVRLGLSLRDLNSPPLPHAFVSLPLQSSMRKLLNSVGSGLFSFVALDGYRRAVINDKKNAFQTRSLKSLQDSKQEFEQAAKVFQEQENSMHANKAEAVASLGRLQEKLETANQQIAYHSKVASQGDINTVTHSSNSVQRSLSDALKEIQGLVDKFTPNSGNSGSTNWTGFDIFSNYSTAEIGAIAHIIASIFILYILFNILLIVYGDALIVYLNLENKYPSFAKFIKLRRKLQKYYLGFSSLMACAVLFFIIYVNLLVFV